MQGDIILLSGFDKFGTFELCRVISRVNLKYCDKDEPSDIDRYIKFYLNKNNYNTYMKENNYIEAEDFFCILNRVIEEKKKLNESYCIEAVFEFFFEKHEGRKENDIILKYFQYYDIEKREREDLIEECKKIKENKNQENNQKQQNDVKLRRK